MGDFTHLDSDGNATMVDVTDKEITKRIAVACGKIKMSEECFLKVVSSEIKKGDVLQVARIAGIMATKNTQNLIPLCHAINISKVAIDFILIEEEFSIECNCTVSCEGKTGVEMEALMGVSVALLTIYDMCKAIDKSMEIKNIYLKEKIGGKGGHFKNKPYPNTKDFCC